MSPTSTSILIRAFDPTIEEPPLELLHAASGWPIDQRHADLFRWKHAKNPFGPSPCWVALAGERIVGLRAFMRWEFEYLGRAVRAVRAVDTATHPEFQRQGIFSRLTQHALDALLADEVAFVFNTPNDRSGAGYVKMGWQNAGRLTAAVQPTALSVVPRLRQSRVPADRLPLETVAGMPAAQVLEDEQGVATILRSQRFDGRLHTRTSAAHLSWRYGEASLNYRALTLGGDLGQGVAFFRLRQRGSLVEASVGDILTFGGSRHLQRDLRREVAHRSGADVLVTLGTASAARGLSLPVPGPTLMWRALTQAAVPSRRQWRLSLGDVEAF